ncbi:hypothetical protein BLOT_006175, partial [Blomia tropicalis]
MSPNKHKLNLARKLLKILRVVNSHDASVYHIPGNNNPADQFSRPANPSTFVASNPWTLDLSCLPSDLAAITIEPQGVPIDSSSTLLDSYSSLDRMIWSHRPYSFKAHSIVFRVYQQLQTLTSKIENEHFVDNSGITRFTAWDGIAPIWIPASSHLSQVLLTSAHIASRHNGVRLSLAQLPSDVHVCGANRSMIKLIHRCALCRSRRGKQLTVPTGPLYMNSEPAAPFERIAVDGFGPYHLKNGRKFWGIVVVFLSSRCVRIT